MSKGWYSPHMFPFLLQEFLVYIALMSNSVTWFHYRCNSWISFSPQLLAPSCPGLVHEMGGGAGSVAHRSASSFLGLVLPVPSTRLSGRPPAGHHPPKRESDFLF